MASIESPSPADAATLPAQNLTPTVSPDPPSAEADSSPSPFNDLLEKLANNGNGFYLGNPNLADQTKFQFVGGRLGNMAVSLKEDDDGQADEFLMHGVFEIDRQNFYFTPDGGFNPNRNTYNTPFPDLTLTARLIPATRHPNYAFSEPHFHLAMKNLRALEDKQTKIKGHAVTSSLVTSGKSCPSIRVSHHVFEERPRDEDESDTIDDPRFDIVNWPVLERNKKALASIVGSHRTVPLHAYDTNHNVILPSDYERKLAGAIVHVFFALVQHHIIHEKKTVFTPHIRELVVLEPPAAAPRSPLKRGALTSGPTLSLKKARAAT